MTLSRTRYWLYIPLVLMSIFYLLPLFLMLNTGFKSFEEVSLQTMWDFPRTLRFDNFIAAFEVLAPAFWNSIRLVVPASIISAILGSLNGFVLAKWKFPGADFIFPLILFGMFIPYQSILIPLVQFMNAIDLYGGIPGLVLTHVIYGIPITTLTFRNYYASVPNELIEASRMDGAGLLETYWHVLLPLSIPSFVVVLIWQFTASWNDFLFAVILTTPQNWPITVALNNMAGSQIIEWNVQMAGGVPGGGANVDCLHFPGALFPARANGGGIEGLEWNSLNATHDSRQVRIVRMVKPDNTLFIHDFDADEAAKASLIRPSL